LVTTALAFALAVYRVGSGIDVSSASKLGETLAQSAETTGWDNVLHLILRVFYAAVFSYVVLVPLTVSLGFKRQRAIFSGGLTDESRPKLYWLRDRQGVWPWSPKANGTLTLLCGSLAVFSMLQPRLTIWTRRSMAGNV
jgi:hypothetical protein